MTVLTDVNYAAGLVRKRVEGLNEAIQNAWELGLDVAVDVIDSRYTTRRQPKPFLAAHVSLPLPKE